MAKKTAKTTVVAMLTLVAALCAGLCGCTGPGGYSNESLYPQNVSTVYVKMFDNRSFFRGVEYELTDALAKRVETDTPYKVVSSVDRADTVLSGYITDIEETTLTVERETGRALEKEVMLNAKVSWKDLGTGDYLIENRSVVLLPTTLLKKS